ncbi:MAG: hypothetical protein KIS92_07820, partial [Planctomycetota bacterium]|nr:hypothetical protein [Planctomycetota bacterium]
MAVPGRESSKLPKQSGVRTPNTGQRRTTGKVAPKAAGAPPKKATPAPEPAAAPSAEDFEVVEEVQEITAEVTAAHPPDEVPGTPARATPGGRRTP